MPYKSKAQRRKFYQLLKEGKISKDIVEEYERETANISKLPERIGIKKRTKKGRK